MLTGKWKKYPIVYFDMDDIHPRVKQLPDGEAAPFVIKLRASIETHGQLVPITLVYTTAKDCEEFYGVGIEEKGIYTTIPTGEEKFHLITCGNQRYHLLKAMGHTSVPCVVVENLFRGRDMTRYSTVGFDEIHHRDR